MNTALGAPAPAPPSLAYLTWLLSGLCGQTRTLQGLGPMPPDTAAPRAVLNASHLLLPADVAADAVLARAAVAHAAAHVLYSPSAQPSHRLKPMGVAVASAIEDARVEALLMQHLPGVRRWFRQVPSAHDPHGLDFSSWMARLGAALLDNTHPDSSHWVDKARTLFAAATQQHGLQDQAAFRHLASILANDLGQMRVRFNPRQYAVPAPYRDDNSHLWQHAANADAPTDTLQVQVPNRSTAAADPCAHDPAESPTGEQHRRYVYPEWDYRLQRERRDWCTVHESVPPLPPAAALAGPSGAPARARLPAHRLNRHPRLRRQWEGDEIDLDAAVDMMVAHRLALAPEGRVFRRAGQAAPRCRVLVLLDLSASTGERAADAAHTLLAMEQQAALLLARTTALGTDRIAIHGFASDTRAAVQYLRLLDFDQTLDAAHTARILATRAAYSTRIGAALRHATHCLIQEDGEQRAIVLITDGAPSDIDVFDPQYLTEDARAAVLAAQRQGVQCFGLVVDPAAHAYMRRIFGWRNYRVLETPAQLTRQLSALYARLAAA